jgi:hypothetical protein
MRCNKMDEHLGDPSLYGPHMSSLLKRLDNLEADRVRTNVPPYR